jgi:hypothetical protein
MLRADVAERVFREPPRAPRTPCVPERSDHAHSRRDEAGERIAPPAPAVSAAIGAGEVDALRGAGERRDSSPASFTCPAPPSRIEQVLAWLLVAVLLMAPGFVAIVL